uniref:Uncharacterized protein n=1 Tax=Avena sativa TaxID=4498 RepID=A0ACD5UP28_AVESA
MRTRLQATTQPLSTAAVATSPLGAARALHAVAQQPGGHGLPRPPSTCPEEDGCILASSFDLDCARLDWESSALVVWVLNPPSGTDRSDVEDVFRHKFCLRSSDLAVSRHFPEEYLVKLASADLRDLVMCTKRFTFKLNGLEVHFRPWRAISHAYNANLFYRVHLHVEGLPPYVWRPEIVNHMLSRKCAVQRLVDGFSTMEVTSSFGLWAWTSDPHRIPKILWLTFANKALGVLSTLVRVSEDRPDQLKRGITFRVLLHLDTIEDYSNAPVLDGGAGIMDLRPSSHDLDP